MYSNFHSLLYNLAIIFVFVILKISDLAVFFVHCKVIKKSTRGIGLMTRIYTNVIKPVGIFVILKCFIFGTKSYITQ